MQVTCPHCGKRLRVPDPEPELIAVEVEQPKKLSQWDVRPGLAVLAGIIMLGFIAWILFAGFRL